MLHFGLCPTSCSILNCCVVHPASAKVRRPSYFLWRALDHRSGDQRHTAHTSGINWGWAKLRLRLQVVWSVSKVWAGVNTGRFLNVSNVSSPKQKNKQTWIKTCSITKRAKLQDLLHFNSSSAEETSTGSQQLLNFTTFMRKLIRLTPKDSIFFCPAFTSLWQIIQGIYSNVRPSSCSRHYFSLRPLPPSTTI